MTPSSSAHNNQGPFAGLRNYRFAIVTLVTLTVVLVALNAWLSPAPEPESIASAPVQALAIADPEGSPSILPEPDRPTMTPDPDTAPEETPEPSADCMDPPVEAFHELPVGRLPFTLLAVDVEKNPPVAYLQPARGDEILALEVGDSLPGERLLAWAGAEGVILCHAGQWQRVDHPVANRDSLTGVWLVTLGAEGGHTEELGRVELVESPDGQFAIPLPVMAHLSGGDLEGQRTGTRLEVDMMDEMPITTGDGLHGRIVYACELRGETSADLSRFQMSGAMTVTEEIPGHDQQGHTIPLTLRGERLTTLDIARAKYRDSVRERFSAELDSLRDDLSAFFDQHQRLPATLDELLAMLADASPAIRLALEDSLVVRYEPHKLPLPKAETLPPDAAGDPDAIYAFEVEMVRRHQVDAPMPVTVIEFRLTESGERAGISVFPFGRMTTWHRPGEGPQSSEEWAKIRARSQNNLKQLGLVVKMFEQEHYGYTPGGWWSVYPEYLTDLAVLTHPVDDPGTVSYQYMAPVMNFQHLFEATRTPEIRENPAALHQFMSELPIVIERQPYGEPPGRNVLFADGHVEWMLEQTYQQRAREWFP